MNILRNVYDDIRESALTYAYRNTLNLPEANYNRTAARVPNSKPIEQIDSNNRLTYCFFKQ